MKRSLQFLSLTLVLAIFTSDFQAQYINYKDDSGWNIGFNVGGIWQQSDVTTKPGYGLGLTLGRAIYEKEGKLLSFDMRLRYLHGQNKGFNTSISTDLDSAGIYKDYFNSGHFHNHKMVVNNMWDLEGVLTLNRLREKTGIILYGFGGIGATDYTLTTDLKDEFGMPYDYSGFSQTSSELELENIRDGEYETEVADGYKFMPSLGAGIGYQFTPRFSAGIEHKINFPLNDKIDAVEATGGSFVNDRLHYTALTFRWNLFRINSNNPNVTTTVPEPVTNTPLRNKPVVNIINPMHSPYTTHNSSYRVKANVYYVDGKSNITFRHNGMISTNFSYSTSSKRFESNLFLIPGKNVIEIIGKNEAGFDSESKIIIYEQVINTIPPPVVTFTNPNSSPKNVSNSAFTITANVLHVSGPQDITFKVNGVLNPNFNFNVSNQLFSANIILSEGQNTVEIKGVNSVGQDIESVMLIYNEPVQLRPPLVTFTDPTSNPQTVESALYNVYAQVLYIDFSHQAQVLLNGLNIPSFSFNPVTHSVAFQASLLEGSNTVTVIGTNNDGTDSKSTTLIYNAVNEVQPPIVTITQPTNNPENTSMPSATVYANVLNVGGKGDIDLKINGIATTNFIYNTITKVMSVSTALVDGPNVFSITGTNSIGTDNAGTTIIYDKPSTLLPPVISITKPISNPYNTVTANEVINATILHVSEASHVSAKFNGVNTNAFTFDPASRKFSYNGSLIVGANILEIDAWNNAGSASKSQTIIYTNEVPPCNDPVISIKQPIGSPAIVSSAKVIIKGKVKDGDQVDVSVNGKPQAGFKFDSSTGLLEINGSHLQEGANIFEIIAKNSCGKVTHKLTIIYKKKDPPCLEPAISLISPNSYSTSIKGNRLKFSAKIINVENKSMITLKLNESEVPFEYNSESGIIISELNLKYGSNLLDLKAKNMCGGDVANFKISAKKDVTNNVPKPTVEFTSPSTSSYVSEDTVFTVIAMTKNVFASSEISMHLDGEAVPFNFVVATNTITIPVNISEGSHNLVVTVTNANGTAKDEVELIYKAQAPCKVPVITMDSQFTVFRITVTNESGQITGSIADAVVAVVKKNGSNYSDFTYDDSTDRIIINYSELQQGKNTFKIVGHSPCGKDDIEVLIHYYPPSTPCEEPILVIAESSGSSVNVTSDNGMFTSYLGNATSVAVQKDGSAYADFTFNKLFQFK